MADTYKTIEGDTVDGIAWSHYGHHRGTTELILDANRELAAQPLYLPEGLIISLPELPAAKPHTTVKLYD